MWEFVSKTGCYIEKPNTVITRCPFCGDSRRKLYNYGHLYISTEIPFFICFRCNEKGHIRKLLKKFIEVGICNNEQAKQILIKYGDSKNLIKSIKSHKLVYHELDSQLNQQQLTYLLDRIGAKKFDFESFKIVSPKFLIEKTNFMNFKSPIIKKLKSNLNALKYLQDNYIAFISHWDTIIILRHIYNSEPRYIQIYSDNHDSYDFYLANKPLSDFELSQKNYFVIAEGVFDVLNQRVSFNTDSNLIKIAVFGKSRLSKGLSIIRSFFANPKLIYVYLDKDVLQNRFTLAMLKHVYEDVNVRFLYNKLDKDMGSNKILIKELKK